jgi:NhaP-type Na+/H+ or K+/H+ antiporter/Trk K+ transport system NAD-binding subunit
VTDSDIALVVSVALVAGVLVQCGARIVRIPAIVLLLGAGAVLGPEGLGWVRPATLGDSLFVLVDFAVAIILFEGALNLDLKRLKREERVIRLLITTGALITLVGGTLTARLWLGWSWPLATLFGALIVVTGPTVVGPLVRNLRLRPRLQTVLEAEGVFIDPIGALLAVLVLQVTLATDPSQAAAGMRDLAVRVVSGLAIGAAGGYTLTLLLRFPKLVRGLENILVLACVTLIFHLGEHALSQSGLIAVTVAGVIVGNHENPVIDDLREFKDQLTLLLIGTIFILLAADVGMAEIQALGWRGAAVVGTLIVVVRPVSVWLVTRGAGLAAKERVFLAAMAPRGIVAAAVTSLMARTLDSSGIAGGDALRALVFLVISGTVVAAALVAWPLSAVLGLRLAARDRIAVLGAQGLGLALATELRARGANVVLIDNDPQRCHAAERQRFAVVFGDGLQERTLRRARMELVGTVVGATFNENLNSQFVRYARHEFDVPTGLVSVSAAGANGAPEHVVRHRADVLFDAPHDQERWDVRWRQAEVATGHFEYREAKKSAEELSDAKAVLDRRSDTYVILTIQRRRHVAPMSRSVSLRSGDRAAIALYLRAQEQAIVELALQGWHLLPEGTASEEPDHTIFSAPP